MSAAILALLVASPLVAANAIRRQVSLDDFASIGDIATGVVSDIDLPTDLASLSDLVVPTGTALPSGFATSILGGAGDITKCIPPATITLPGGIPTLGPAGAEYAASATDACALFGTSVPSAVAAEVSSYTSALSSWASKNSAALSSYEKAASSFYDSVKTDPACSGLYSTAFSIATDGACPGVATGKASGSAGSGASVTSAGASGSSARTTTAAAGSGATSGAASGAAATTSRAPGTGAGATIAPNNAVLMAGASIAITSLIGMIFL